VVSFLGFAYPTRMAVVRLADGGLWLWSPVALGAELERELRGLGEVKWIVTPNKLHHLFLDAWLAGWPTARCFAPPGLAVRRKDLRFDAELGDAPDAGWAGEIDQVVVRGSAFMEEVLFFHRESSTCLVGDLIQRHDPRSLRGWKRVLMQLDALTGPAGSTPREWRASFFGRQPARAALRTALAWSPERLIIAHGACAQSGGSAVLETGLRWITRPWPI